MSTSRLRTYSSCPWMFPGVFCFSIDSPRHHAVKGVWGLISSIIACQEHLSTQHVMWRWSCWRTESTKTTKRSNWGWQCGQISYYVFIVSLIEKKCASFVTDPKLLWQKHKITLNLLAAWLNFRFCGITGLVRMFCKMIWTETFIKGIACVGRTGQRSLTTAAEKLSRAQHWHFSPLWTCKAMGKPGWRAALRPYRDINESYHQKKLEQWVVWKQTASSPVHGKYAWII